MRRPARSVTLVRWLSSSLLLRARSGRGRRHELQHLDLRGRRRASTATAPCARRSALPTSTPRSTPARLAHSPTSSRCPSARTRSAAENSPNGGNLTIQSATLDPAHRIDRSRRRRRVSRCSGEAGATSSQVSRSRTARLAAIVHPEGRFSPLTSRWRSTTSAFCRITPTEQGRALLFRLRLPGSEPVASRRHVHRQPGDGTRESEQLAGAAFARASHGAAIDIRDVMFLAQHRLGHGSVQRAGGALVLHSTGRRIVCLLHPLHFLGQLRLGPPREPLLTMRRAAQRSWLH